MNHWMQAILRGFRTLVLVLLVAVATAGCQRSAKCYEPGVLCADEFGKLVRFMPGSKAGGSDIVVQFGFVQPESEAGSKSALNFDASCEPVVQTGYPTLVGDLFEINWSVADGPRKCTGEVSDVNAALGTSQMVEVCIDATGKQSDCKAWAVAPVPDPVKVDDNNAADVAKNVRCGKLTYTVTDQLVAGVNVPWSDLTWTVRTPNGYDIGKLANSRGYHFDADWPGPFSSKASASSEMLNKNFVTDKYIVSLAARKATELRLPLRMPLTELVNANKTNTDVLRAGWVFKDTASGKEVNIGCSIKQAVLVKIVETALGGQPIGDQTVHIFFNASSDKQPLGEDGWCYGIASKGPFSPFKPHNGTENGAKCKTFL